MFDTVKLDSIPKFEDFHYWFKRISDDEFAYASVEQSLLPTAYESILNQKNLDSLPDDIKNDFNQFTVRPEYRVGDTITINTASATSNNQNFMVDQFEELIVGYTFIRALESGKTPEESFPIAARFLEWIRNTDFYYCPASTRFHDAEPCGLIFHTLNVYNNMVNLHRLDKFKNTDYASITIVANSHDLTKIGNYESYLRSVKNDMTGDWDKVPAYRWKNNPFPFGHGVASMYLASQFFRLTMEEMIAIRWHMAEYRVASQEVGELEDACERYPLVRMVQFADQLACVKY